MQNVGTHQQSEDELRADIARTRALRDDVHALREQASGANVRRRVRQATIGRAGVARARQGVRESGGALWQSAQENPIPTAIVAGGIAWLLYSASQRRRDGMYGEYAAGGDLEHGDECEDARWAGAADRSSRLREGMVEAGSAGRERMQAIGAAGRERAQQLRRAGQERAEHLAPAQDLGHRAGESAQGAFNRSPLTMGAVAMLAGFGAALLFPRTQRSARLPTWLAASRTSSRRSSMRNATVPRRIAQVNEERGRRRRPETGGHRARGGAACSVRGVLGHAPRWLGEERATDGAPGGAREGVGRQTVHAGWCLQSS